MLYTLASQVDFGVVDLPAMPVPRKVLFVEPTHFDVSYVINPHMSGKEGTVDTPRAVRQWEMLRRLYAELGFETHTIPGVERLPDMVFCANQTLPFLVPDSEDRGIVESRMHAQQRSGEVSYVVDFFENRGYRTVGLPKTVSDFEGMGDALWHPGRFLLWGGYGFRSSVKAYEHIADLLGVRIVVLHLEDADFYHLDTCLAPLNENTALFFPGAFDEDGRKLIASVFDTLVEVPEREARELFGCNAHCPDGKHVIIQAGASTTIARLRAAGFTPIEVRTEEFLKAGGSVFCTKQMFW